MQIITPQMIEALCALGSPTTLIGELTPELATFLLEKNPDNRLVRDSTVDSYARDMAAGNWSMNGEPIIISKDCLLNDGQHRCWAVVNSGRSIITAFVVGVARDTRSTVDQGVARRLSDYLKMDNVVAGNASRVATIAGMIYRYKQSGSVNASSGRNTGATARATKQELMDMIKKDTSIERAVNNMVPYEKGMNAIASHSIFTFCYWLIVRTNESHDVEAFIERIVRGIGLNNGDPELYVRNRLLLNKGRIKANEAAELIIRAWNAHCRGEHIKSFPINGGKLPDVKRYKA
jgi:hypothetical protein